MTGKSVAELSREIREQYGTLCYEDADFTMSADRKKELMHLLFTEKQMPAFGTDIASVSYEDVCKIRFCDGSWEICRFSGTEPLLRIAAEAGSARQAQEYIRCWKEMLGL